MDLHIRRIILFTSNMEAMAAFYRDVIGLKAAGREAGWIDFDAGACHLALHEDGGKPGRRPPKIVFHAKDVAAARAMLIRRGVKMGPVVSATSFDMCNGKDPDGNPFQISSRP
ncbi:MAG: VOC family protein [Hyphomonas sp.]|nr:VOC family protein [Hyphomonas sp.]